MGTTHQLPARRSPAQLALTLSVLLSLLAAHLVTLGIGTAAASPFDFRGELTFQAFADQAEPTPNELSGDPRTLAFDVADVPGNDVAIPGFHWLGADGAPDAPREGEGRFHLSCSQTISGTFAIALEGNELGFDAGTRLQITAFESTRAKNGRDQTTCDDGTFATPPTAALTVVKVVEGPIPTDAGGARLPFELVVSCQQNDLPGEEPDISWSWMEKVFLVDGGAATLAVADEADCWVEEIDTLAAVRTTWQVGDDAPVEGLMTGPIRVPADGSRTVTFTNTFEENAPTPAIALVKTAVDADVPSTVEDGTLVLDVADRDGATVTYDYVVTNVGEEALVALTLDDDLIGALNVDLAEVELAVGASVTVTATYTVTPEELAAGLVTSVATATGQGRVSEVEVTASDDETVFLVDVGGAVLTTPQDPEPTAAPEVLGTQLPRTGIAAVLLATGGLLLAALGIAVVLVGRREHATMAH